MDIWTAIRDAPLWLLRTGFAIVGFVDGVGLVVLLAVLLMDFGPLVEVTVKNESPQGATVRLDSVELESIANSAEATLTNDTAGEHCLEIVPDTADAILIDLRFNADRSGAALSVELLASDGSSSVN